ncbi:MAG: hypothetical protein ACPL3C_08565 [Pyrobaculum sp.]
MDDIYVVVPWPRKSRHARAVIQSVLKALEQLGYATVRIPRRCLKYCDRHEKWECACCWVDERAVIFELQGGVTAYKLVEVASRWRWQDVEKTRVQKTAERRRSDAERRPEASTPGPLPSGQRGS